ncbi:MAG: hypothetical protein ABIK99_04685 [candidate division WOR-3 bacterium]
MDSLIKLLLAALLFFNCFSYARKEEKTNPENLLSQETDVSVLAERYCEKKNISQERLVSYIHSFIPTVNTWSDIKKISPGSWPEVEKKVDALLAKEGMRLFTVFSTWFIGWNFAYLLWRFGTKW